MTLQKGFHKPLPRQIRHIREKGDGTFSVESSIDEFVREPLIPPCPPGWERAEPESPVMLLKLSDSVEPHEDWWVADAPEPKQRGALFWLLWARNPCYFGVEGAKSVKLFSGDWVFFDDSKEHWLMAKGMWLGCAWQLRPKETI